MSDSKRIKDMEDEVDKLRRRIDTVAAQANAALQEIDKRIKNLEDQGDI